MNAKGVLEGRVAIVTGAARGIGAAITERLVAEGASVIVADTGTGIDGRGHDRKLATAFAAKLGQRAFPFADDVADASAAAALVGLAQDRFGGLDIVVNNAAILRDTLIFKSSPADWDEAIRVNLSAAHHILSFATPVLRENAKADRGGAPYGWGRIVNIISSAGFIGNYGQSSYAASKAGLFGLTRIVALDMSRSNVTCNAVVPFAHTRVTDSIKPASPEQAAYKEGALKVEPSHVGTLVAYLCSPAAQRVSGQLIGVRGREVFIFSQPRPVKTIVRRDADWDIAGLAGAVERELAPSFAPLITDLEVFNTAPAI